jgi:hypothetical protein
VKLGAQLLWIGKAKRPRCCSTVEFQPRRESLRDENTRGGFSHGRWANPGNDDAMVQAIGERMAKPGSGLLLGRRTRLR